jgi:hypothetical protein
MRFLWGLYEISMSFLWDSCRISIYIGFICGFKIISCCVIKENKSNENYMNLISLLSLLILRCLWVIKENDMKVN